MSDNQPKDPLPGNQGQFGASDATEDYKPLEDQPAAASKPDAGKPGGPKPGDLGPKQTNAGERS